MSCADTSALQSQRVAYSMDVAGHMAQAGEAGQDPRCYVLTPIVPCSAEVLRRATPPPSQLRYSASTCCLDECTNSPGETARAVLRPPHPYQVSDHQALNRAVRCSQNVLIVRRSLQADKKRLQEFPVTYARS